jgi:hypothetical protein
MNSESIPVSANGSDNTFESRRRSKHFLDWQQLRFALSVVFYAALFPVFFLGLLATITKMQILLTGDIPDQGALHETLQVRTLNFAYDHIWLLIGTLVYIGVLTLIFSHRIFGPMRSFEAALQERLENPGEPVNCRIRKGDYFRNFSRLFEDALNTRISVKNRQRSKIE